MTDRDVVPRRRSRRWSWLRLRLKKLSRRRRGQLLGAVATVAILGLFACVAEQERSHESPVEGLVGEPTIRVLLVEGAKSVKVGATGACQIVPSHGEPLLVDKLEDQALTPGDGTGVQLGERRFFGSLECRFIPGAGAHVRIEGKPYGGEMLFRVDRGVVRAVNHVRAEEYVAGVLGGEMPINWPDAALEAQSVAARTYVIYHWKNHKSDDHDVLADTRSQVYVGVPTERARSLVRATEGRVLTWQWRVFEAFFMSSCSGQTASAEWVFGGPAIQPLQGATCGACTQSKNSTWVKEIPSAELARALAGYGVKAPVQRVDAVAWPHGGYVRELRVQHAGGETSIPGTKVRTALQLKSAAFQVQAGASGDSIVVTGHGWGHGVGLCQWGARGSAEAGLDGNAILHKYYPGSEIAKLY